MKPNDQLPVVADDNTAKGQWKRFGRLLRDRRNATGMSRIALAKQAKLSDATIKFLETARHPPSRATLIRLLAIPELKLTWDDVPGQHEQPVEPPTPPTTPEASAGPPEQDPAKFLMNLLGFDEIALPPGSPEMLRFFQRRPADK